MGVNARKKERRRLKRLKKRQEFRRRRGISPYLKQASSGHVETCVINSDWRQAGEASILVFQSSTEGTIATAYLVDLWCAGLKDAYGRRHLTRDDFEEAIRRREVPFERVDLETVRRLVAGGVRFAAQNGFRLPPHYQRWLSVIGIGDWRSADLDDFGVGGKLRWCGSMEDLSDRLIGCSVSEFLARKDVEFVFGPSELEGVYLTNAALDELEVEEEFEDEDDDADDADDEDEEVEFEEEAEDEIIDLMEEVRRRALDGARKWCFAQGQLPHPRLDDAVKLALTGMVSNAAREEARRSSSPAMPLDAVDALLADVADQPGMHGALEQWLGFMRTFESPEALGRYLRLDQLPREA